MANRYWVGGTASWDGTAGTKWSLTSGGAGGEAVPTSADDVFFDASSGANTVTIAAGNTGAKSITCTGFTGTLAGSAAITLSGSLILVAGMTYSYTGDITFNGTATLTSAGKSIGGSVTVDGSGITVTLGSAFSQDSAKVFTVTQGTFTTNNFTFTPGDRFTITGTQTRTVNLGSSTVSFNNSGGMVNAAVTTNLTFNAGTSTISLGGNTAGPHELGGLTYYNVNILGTTGNRKRTINGANTFNNLAMSAASGGATGRQTNAFSANQTINGSISTNTNFPAANSRVLLRSTTYGTPITFTIASVGGTFRDVDFMDITVAGAAAPLTGSNLGDAGGNSQITFAATKTVYAVSLSSNWYGVTFSTTSGGSASAANFPLPGDTVIVDDNSGAAGGTLGIGSSSIFGVDTLVPALDFSSRSNSITVSQPGVFPNDTSFFYGSVSFSSAVTVSGTGDNIFANRTGTLDITSSGKSWSQAFNIQSIGATVRLVDDCTTSRSVTSTNGTLDLNGKTLSTTQYITAAGTKNLTFNGGTLAVSNSGSTAFNNAQPTNFTTTKGTGTGKISMTATSAKTFVGGGSTYNCTLSNDGAGALTITGSNTFTALANGVQPTTFTFTAGTTTTVTDWNVSGAPGNLVTIGSATSASHTLSKASGTVSADYLSISRSTATGGATWNAGSNSVNGGNNSGWIFGGVVGNNFMFFFT